MTAPTPSRPAALTGLILLLAALAPASARAQGCGLGGVQLQPAAERAHYDLGPGLDAWALGGDLALQTRRLGLRIGYRKLVPERGAARPDMVRGALTVPFLELWGVRLCAVARAGASRFSEGGDDASVIAGGAGVRLALPARAAAAAVVPFLEVRGLAAQSSGTILGLDVGASGESIGVAGGVDAALGRLTVRATASLDGFDAGLGLTPYPAWSVGLAVGVRL